MERKEFRQYVKRKFRELGFQSRKSCHFLMPQEDYLIGFELATSTYAKGYYFECGCLFLPNLHAVPFYGYMDLRRRFLFPLEPGEQFDIHKCLETEEYTRICEYEKYTEEQLDPIFEQNFEYYMRPFYDPEYGLQMIRELPQRMNYHDESWVRMVCRRAGLDADEILPSLSGIRKGE